ncbi:MAG: efflux RND transporter periplasmic adaptor subunit [Acidobacteria bacterium]|nr:efflux RND transporter periplasmic adaptor subunit [Acidobacteriota bacterium]
MSIRSAGLLILAAAAACGGGQSEPAAGAAPGGGAPPGTPVEMVTLEERPIEDVSEYVGTVKSRRSTTIQPQAEGFLRRIAVKSGDRVAAGALLAEIDNAPQQAAIAAIQSTRAAREADATFARQQAARTKALLDIGAVSLVEAERADATLKAAEAQLKALDEQIRQAQIEMGYYRVTSPVAGVVGDVPVRVGDRVTRQTVLTTVEDNAGLEAYINVPVQDAPRLKVGLPVRLLGEDGTVLASERLNFVAGVVDDTQTVLAKATLGAGAAKFRADQFIRARVVWSEAPGLVAPLTSVTRIGGQYFVYVAEPGDGGVLVARMRPVTLGSVIGNDYVVREGLKPGERLITGGIQKIGDGAPVAAGGK